MDDEPLILRSLQRLFRDRYDVTTATSGEEGLQLIEQGPPFAAIVSDLVMPGAGGTVFLSQARYAAPNSIRILYTAKDDYESMMEAINHGYVFKIVFKASPCEILRSAVESAVQYHRLIAADEKTLQNLVFKDDLTQLHNRRYFEVVLSQEHIRCLRYHHEYSLAFIDLDGVREINTKYGHIIGSQAIETVASIIASSSRESDYTFRFGGDEFVTLLVETGKKGAMEYCRRVLEAIKARPLELKGQLVQITASAGVATYPDDGDSSLLLLDKADQALYSAKKMGKGRVAEV